MNLLKNAIKRDDILVYFQPIFENTTGKINKYECLIRVCNRDGEILSPASFLNVVKETRLYADITEIMIRKSISIMENTPYEFSINLSIGDLIDKKFNNFIREIFHRNRGIAKRITFEIVESEGIENYQVVHDFIHEMKEYGCKMAIDDFGAGYSNFEHILRLDVNYLKIDSSMIKNIDTDIYSQIIVETIVNFVKKLDIEIIAEFVHSEKIFHKVKALGVDYSQGYYIGKPKPVIQ
jgi:EAL domain-containing protein (putative c-di-GMP-specific phosphodiesterase class I)